MSFDEELIGIILATSSAVAQSDMSLRLLIVALFLEREDLSIVDILPSLKYAVVGADLIYNAITNTNRVVMEKVQSYFAVHSVSYTHLTLPTKRIV